MSGEIKLIGPSGQTCDANVLNSSGQRWNGSSFETFSAGNIASYRVTVTEDGTTGLYRGDMPTAIAAGDYDILLVLRSTGRAIGAQSLNDWGGVASSSTPTILGSLSGEEMKDYIVSSGWLRDDMDDEIYAAMTDTILEMEQLFQFDERETESATTDTITVLGDYRINVQSDMGHLISVNMIDDDYGKPLKKISKAVFDALYPNPSDTSNTGYPEHYALFGGQILIGPTPDRTDYQYTMAYSTRLTTAITAATDPVPFSGKYREVLKDGSMERLYKNVKKFDLAAEFRNAFDKGMGRATTLERRNRSGAFSVDQFSI